MSCYELGHRPLGITWPQAFLERAGYGTATLDLAVEPLDAARLAAARALVVSVPMHTALRRGLDVLQEIRLRRPDVPVLFHGLYAHLHADLLRQHGADAIAAGECEDAIVDWVRGLAAGKPPRGAGRVADARPRLDRLAFPAPPAGAVDLRPYARFEHDGERRIAGVVEASRGCRSRCRHCPVPAVYGGRFFAVPVKVVLAHVHRQVESGARHVSFADADFLNGPQHALRIARAVHAAFPELSFDFTAKIEHLVREARHLAELADCGAAFVVSAVECLDDAILARLDKGHTRRDVDVALAALRRAGIALRPSWMPFTPWATRKTLQRIFDWVAAEDLVEHVDPVQYTMRLLLPPGSLLLEHPDLQPHLGAYDPARLGWTWTHPDPDLDALHAAMLERVEADTRAGTDPVATFEVLAALVGSTRRVPRRRRQRPPRLTEAWFC